MRLTTTGQYIVATRKVTCCRAIDLFPCGERFLSVRHSPRSDSGEQESEQTATSRRNARPDGYTRRES